MEFLMRIGAWLKKAFLFVLALLCVVVVFWGILYKIFLPFSPLWLDEITIVSVPIALLIMWAMGRSSENAGQKDEARAEPNESVPDAASQLLSDD